MKQIILIGVLFGLFVIGSFAPGQEILTGGGSRVTVVAPLPAGTNAIGSITNTSFGVTGPLPSGTNDLGFVRIVPQNTCGPTPYDSGYSFVPGTLTAVTGTLVCPQTIDLVNTDSAASHTITITDNSTLCSGGPCTIIGPNFTLDPLTSITKHIDGKQMVGGIKWSADTANKISGYITGNTP